ncbi:MAG TPA: NADH-quinone oxidoreductase subunit NuoF [Candidatus Sumerlaeota bacterium]|nr:NADH-quinone oxidoreductase subunit NuoF [Candidatus Sumerlaeota bacterium]
MVRKIASEGNVEKPVTLEQLNRIKAREVAERQELEQEGHCRILLCAGAGCIASGALEVKAALDKQALREGVAERVSVIETGCLGPCAKGPVLLVNDVFYEQVTPDDAEDIMRQHVIEGQVVERLVHRRYRDSQPQPHVNDISFFRKQTKIVLRNCGIIDPQKIDDYIARDGYQALAKVLAMKPEDVIAEMQTSGLRGRGGAGFPTWRKWQFTRQAAGDKKYVLCNADEGDPGAFMDRSVLEGDPHSIIEGMAIAAYTVGANEGYVYVRAEYPLAVQRLTIALEQARDYGLLGQNILGKGFDFTLEIRMGSGAFVCGEETALITSIEGNRGEPRPRPPFPANKGLWGKPTVLNNVETYANVPAILLNGGAWYASFGSEKSKGTKVFALAGAIKNAGLVEVPIGTTLGDLVYDIGGGIPGNKEFKAAQAGGPSGGCVPREHLSVPLDYDSLAALGAIMGSGGLIVMDEDTCMVDVARFFLEFVQEESCGKCVPCRVGTKRMLEILERICNGQGRDGDIETLIELGNQIKDTALCGLGQTAPNPVLSTIRHFRDEYVAHIRDKRCPAAVCPSLVDSPCRNACPSCVDIPGFLALVRENRIAEALRLHRERNPFAAVCARVCFHSCESKCRRTLLDADPVAIRGVKRFMVDQEITMQVPAIRENEGNSKRRIGIIGAGPAGLSCAYFLARLGYRPTVFESEPRPGGMLVQTIPAYRLPREVLAREIRMIEQMGVEIETGKRLGRDFTLPDLRAQGYDAVFIGIGAPLGMRMGIPGQDSEGVVDAMDFHRTYNLRGSVRVGKNVIVVGGGNSAIDAARTALRLGAECVTIVYRRTREEMPAYAEEIEEAIHEGVALRMLTQPVEVIAENNRVTGLKCRPMRLGGFDRSGRRSPTAGGEDFTIPCDQVLVAIGQALDLAEIASGVQIETKWNQFVNVDPVTGQTSVEWIFAGGDCVSGPDSVVGAVAHGERAAAGIDEFLTGENHAFWREDHMIDVPFDPDAEPDLSKREKMPTISIERRRNNFEEVEHSCNEMTAVRQASRCLRCDYGKR